MGYKKSELTKFAKGCVLANKILLDGICISEEINGTDIGKDLLQKLDDENQELIFEISKRFAKYTSDQMSADTNLNDRTLSDMSNILEKIVNCCEENNWFEVNQVE